MDFGAKNGVILRSGFFGWIKHLDTSDMDYKKWDVSNLRGGWNSNSSSFLGRFISIYIYTPIPPSFWRHIQGFLGGNLTSK